MPTPTPARHVPYARGSIFRKYPLSTMMEEKVIRFIPIPGSIPRNRNSTGTDEVKAAQRNPRLISKLPVMARIRHDINFIKIDINGEDMVASPTKREPIQPTTDRL